MSILFLFLSALAMNRDESFLRETANLQYWPDTQTFCGRDLAKGGTWLAINKKGKLTLKKKWFYYYRMDCCHYKYQINPIKYIKYFKYYK